MSKTYKLRFDQHIDDFIESQVENGKYATIEEVISAGLSLLENSGTKAETLEELLVEGEQSGPSDYDYHTLINELSD